MDILLGLAHDKQNDSIPEIQYRQNSGTTAGSHTDREPSRRGFLTQHRFAL
jgi:hypothetical protein